MDEITTNLKNRSNLLEWVPISNDFNKMVEEVETKYPGFKAKDKEFNPNRVRYINEQDHYEFYLEREQ